MKRKDLLKLANELETLAGDLPFCDANVKRHMHMMSRAANLRRIAAQWR